METDARLTILVVDDEPAVLDLVTRMLEVQGFDTLSAEDGDAALTALTEEGVRVDLVLLDLHLPGRLTGLETYRALRDLDEARPVLLVSGDPEDPDLGTLPTEAPVLAKPFSVHALAARIRGLLAGET